MDLLATAVLDGDVRVLARLISRIENDPAAATAAMSALFPHTGRAFVLGVTGAPGAGKSTLVDGLIRYLRACGSTVAVLAVDPSSPVSGGAILGDRVRMQAHAGDGGVYIRSMSARGRLGGLALATRQAVHVLDAAGYAVVIVETVGVGQSELEIAGAADTVLVVTTPAMGDAVQVMKAGILEIADVFAVNKADQPGASSTVRALRAMVHDGIARVWQPPVIETRAHEGEGIRALWEAIAAHRAAAEASGELERRRAERLRREILEAVEQGLRTDVLRGIESGAQFGALVTEVIARRRDPESAARTLLSTIRTASASPSECRPAHDTPV